ncbi:MAG: lysylphosphatidylglycerol synthase transmembrane domain-containing protein [Candidatus Cryptobacteroides sp.]
MNNKVRKTVRYILLLLLAAVLLYFAFREVRWTEFKAALGSCRWEWIAASMLFGVISFSLRGLRWRRLLLPIDSSTSFRTCFNAVNISYAVNLALPRVGEFVRCGFITARSAPDPSVKGRRLASYDKVLGTAALERSADLVAMASILGIFLLATWGRFGSFFMEKVFGQAAEGFNPSSLWIPIALAACAGIFIALCVWLRDRLPFMGKIAGFCKGLWQGFVSCVRMGKGWLFLLQTLLVWCCYWMMSYSVLLAVQGMDTSALSEGMASCVRSLAGLGPVDALFLMLVGSLSSIVPVPGGFGAFHFLVAGAISSLYGVPFEFGMVFATLSHESQTLVQIVCGGLSYLDESIRN